MRQALLYAVGMFMLSACAASYGPYRVATAVPYGACCVPYGDGRQPGVAFTAPYGTPVIAPADGVVTATGENSRFGGYFVRVDHGQSFDSYYTHLSNVRVANGQSVRRGDLIGLTGQDHTGRRYLHFGLCKKGGSCVSFPDSIDPDQQWLGGQLRCFESGTDYSRHSQSDLTVPLACGEHARLLIAQIEVEKSK